jgi:hypothetical protein
VRGVQDMYICIDLNNYGFLIQLLLIRFFPLFFHSLPRLLLLLEMKVVEMKEEIYNIEQNKIFNLKLQWMNEIQCDFYRNWSDKYKGPQYPHGGSICREDGIIYWYDNARKHRQIATLEIIAENLVKVFDIYEFDIEFL